MQPFFNQLATGGPIVDEEFEDCFNCDETKPLEGGVVVTVGVHRIEGRIVAEDHEWICADCDQEARDMEWP